MPLITVRGPVGIPVSYRFEESVITVGRSAAVSLRLHDPALSRVHAEIRRDGGGWVVADAESRNGTLLNGRRLDAPAVLSPGDELAIGQTTLVFDAEVEGAVSEMRVTAPAAWSSRGNRPAHAESALVGRSAGIRAVLALIDRVAASDVSVLVLGENGTGKELVARLIHRRSARVAGPFVVVNCPALPGSLCEAELFGVERGVATGVDARTGRLETAEGGTLLLDEIGDMDGAAQAKILRFLQDRTFERIGGREPKTLDVRVLAATNHDLRADMDRGAFRRDLFHRLNTVTIQLPPLRERREDIPLLAAHFLASAGGEDATISEEAMALLHRYEFPGNVRELQQVIHGALVLCERPRIGPEHFPPEIRCETAAANGAATAEQTVELEPGANGNGNGNGLYERVVERGESFWDVVADPYLRRRVSRDDAAAFVRRAYASSGASYKGMARLLRVESEYKRLLNFLQYHGLGARD